MSPPVQGLRRLAVVGAGISGLVAAYEASRHPGWQVELFEASARLGGIVETVHSRGFTIECGPDAWVSERGAARQLAEELGLADELISSNDAIRQTYLARDGALVPLPTGMRMMVPTRWEPILESPLFSEQAREAYRREPGRAAELKAAALARSPDEDESVRSFVSRHFGGEATDTIAGPLLAGVFGGDIDVLSAGAVLAPFVALEREHGSLVMPVMRRAASALPQPIFTTLRSGLGTLIDRLAADLPPGAIHRRTPVAAIAPAPGGGWLVRTQPSGESSPHAGAEPFDAVVLAVPPDAARTLLASLDPAAAALLPTEASSAVVVALCFAPEVSRGMRVPQGFGFLVPPARSLPSAACASGSAPELLAGTFMDQKFHHRAPPGAVFLRGFFGGAGAAELASRDDAQVAELTRERFSRFLGDLPAPSLSVVRRWPRSLPQYLVGHPARMRALAVREQRLAGLALVGKGYEGVGLPALVESSRAKVRSLLSHPLPVANRAP